MMQKIDDSNYEATIRTHSQVIIKFGAGWCGPCRVISPVLDDLSETIEGVKFFSIDIDDSPDSALKMNVRAVPTLVFYKNGDEVKREVGAISKQRLTQIILETFSV